MLSLEAPNGGTVKQKDSQSGAAHGGSGLQRWPWIDKKLWVWREIQRWPNTSEHVFKSFFVGVWGFLGFLGFLGRILGGVYYQIKTYFFDWYSSFKIEVPVSRSERSTTTSCGDDGRLDHVTQTGHAVYHICQNFHHYFSFFFFKVWLKIWFRHFPLCYIFTFFNVIINLFTVLYFK